MCLVSHKSVELDPLFLSRVKTSVVPAVILSYILKHWPSSLFRTFFQDEHFCSFLWLMLILARCWQPMPPHPAPGHLCHFSHVQTDRHACHTHLHSLLLFCSPLPHHFTTLRPQSPLPLSSPGTKVIGAKSMEEMVKKLKKPRRVMMLVKAGAAVDSFIDQLVPLLEKGDIIIDGGNSEYLDTQVSEGGEREGDRKVRGRLRGVR